VLIDIFQKFVGMCSRQRGNLLCSACVDYAPYNYATIGEHGLPCTNGNARVVHA